VKEEDLCYLPATELALAIRRKEISPVESVSTILERIRRLEPKLNAMSHVLADSALARARAAEAAIMRGEVLGPLHGVTVSIKDSSGMVGVSEEMGSYICKGSIGTQDAIHVARLIAAGAIPLGKTTVSEVTWSGLSRNPLTGVTHNPWKRGFNAGASSAGAAVAAAAGYGPLHDGSDGMGSIRIPAHFCGVVGLKPTYGRVPHSPVSYTDSMTHIGSMTRTVADAALMLQVIAGPHYLDHTCIGSSPPDYPAGLYAPLGARRRIAFSHNLGHARVDADVAGIVEAAVSAIQRDLKLEIELASPRAPEDIAELAKLFLSVHMSTDAPSLPMHESSMEAALVSCIRDGLKFSALDFLNARIRKHRYVAEIQTFFESHDFLLTPSVSVAAFPIDRIQPEHWPQHPWDYLMWTPFSYPFNFSGNPAISIPCGFTAAGLPVGLQIVGRRFDEMGVLQLAAAFEKIRPWASRRPVVET
jgi:aspartyl-tRNA(Asn)/glutamyl-tRNA(Gln) amidotransferase subunit A